ncbi:MULTISPECIES: competence/damage-inducible protein A [Prochlorococcus]|uniref:competence/damage-inducible protein A n=1 Tax=Prochlorococcus TaxID=1218 RepID=UPI0005337E21|nr:MULTISPECIES: competence/damage-inducible protein A [Prochlorococcus]KGG13108.1 Molybdopterin binding motif [Prochlorococcus sp. MIT 0601]
MSKHSQEKTVEILCIGSELLLGNILNSNAQWLAEKLASIGLSHFRQTVVGDNFDRLKEFILATSQRTNILITTGGLGPTPDDLTTETIAAAFNTPLIESKEILIDIKKKVKYSSKDLPLINKKQALYPKGSKLIHNPTGTAPGIIWNPNDDFTIITLPGVPSEMKNMWDQSIEKWLKENSYKNKTITSKVLKFTGISESELTEKVNDILEGSNPTISPYASLGEVRLRITSKAENIERANALIEPIQHELIQRARKNYFGSDEDTLASIIIDLLRQRNETLSVAESCTGGGLGASLTSVSGASDIFLGGIIAYHNSIKKSLLNVRSKELLEDGAVSAEVVQDMALGVKKKLGTDWGLAISGIAGPSGGTPNKPVGLVQFGIAGPNILESIEFQFNPYIGRIGIQKLSVIRSLDILRLFILHGAKVKA